MTIPPAVSALKVLVEACRAEVANIYVPEHAELSTRGLEVILDGSSPQLLCDALYSFWVDVRNRTISDSCGIGLAALRTVQLLQDGSPDMSDMLEEFFVAWHQERTRLLTTLENDLFVATTTALAEATAEAWCQFGVEWRTDFLHAVDMANSVVAVAPAELSTAFLPLIAPEKLPRQAWFYVSALMYRGDDHPLGPTRIPLWSRFGQSRGVRWDDQTVAGLAELLEPNRIQSIISASAAAMASWLGEETWDEVRKEMEAIQLHVDFPVRKAWLLKKLGDSSLHRHDLDWNDEYGEIL